MGYKPEQFVKAVDENFHCPICHDVFQDPVSCKDGHTFCSSCIGQWLKTRKTCPLDNSKITDKKLVRNLTVSNIIDNMLVYCHLQDQENEEPVAKKIKQENGTDEGVTKDTCEWSGKLQELKKHKESCAFQEVQCHLEYCPTKIQRRELNNHIQTCTYKKVTCKDCQLELRQRDLQRHHDSDCPDALIPCPNNCGNDEDQGQIKRPPQKLLKHFEVRGTINRSDIIYHLDHACGKETVACPFAEQGCSIKVLRKEIETHLQDVMPSHMLLLAKQNTQLIKENETLRNEITSIKDTVKTVAHSLLNAKKNLQDQLSSTNSYTWTIRDYPAIAKKYPNDSSFKSPTFWLCGYKLNLSMCPNGDKAAPGHLSLYLHVSDDQYESKTPGRSVVPNSERTISFRLSVISQKPGVNDVFQQGNCSIDKYSKSWGWPKFIAKDDAISLCNNTGNLKIKCTLGPNS